MSSLDPVTLAVLSGRMEQIADEMDAVLFRSAFNPIIAEAHDASHGFYHAKTGDTLVQGKTGLPIFVGVMSFAVKAVIEKAAEAGDLQDGDIFIFNDAHIGGTHLSDMRLVRPFFHNGQVFCNLASVGHWHDVGGAVPGNYNPSATEAFQEAFILPPVRIVRSGKTQSDILDIILRNTRLPQSALGDLNGQLNALDVGVKRMSELLDEYGQDTISAAFDALVQRAEILTRDEISKLPNGRWEAIDYLDNDGICDKPLPIKVALEISGDTLTVDFTGTAPAAAGPLNIAEPTSIACCYVAIKHIFSELPANAGVMRPITVILPTDSLLSAQFPSPTGGYTETILRMIDVIFSAMAQAAPEKTVANSYGTINALSIAGYKLDGNRWVMFSFYGGGHGGSEKSDGLNHGNAPISTATIPPAEILEAAYPVLFREWSLRKDSAGAGENRGGLGATYEIELLDDTADVFLFGERGKFPPKGIAGGEDAATNHFEFEQDHGWETPDFVSKGSGIKIKKGQRVRLNTPGGGGYGPPANRSPQRVRADVTRGYISEAAADHHYGQDWRGQSK